ncbi:biotin/lipoyl-binding protein [Corallincola holothuriorum]|uniref:Biotin carboxylase n=1 Tax=Corallincola holothuriorum TaxID=2282215 RepID=A0A368NHF6_9GAMM|nr:biotin carboxylase N-terminal domain-containing protein [Corallincola holothuriorum]RCU49616.1 biotin/lipoyl-binding protein [Corallincola holothuriorum]
MKQLLIANRGEIACRIIRSARAAGWHTVAIYSDVDANARHVRLADEAHLIGVAAAEKSYLAQHKILSLASTLNVDAIHPGYGFLAENAEFAAACEQAGIAFVGPSSDAIDAMGDKANAKAIMAAAGVPLLADYRDAEQRLPHLQQAAQAIGYPLLIKATCGGGGRGMRIVDHADDFETALASAKREAKAAFGDDRVLLEPFLKTPRHVEVQILADQQGNTIYLGDRDCSVQRRHQKVVEEAPAPGLPPALRAAMGEAAVQAAKAIGYVGAGTVEFLLDDKQQFYFMEMNTRLQVEHPVTEMVCGIDLVRWQLAIAEGKPLTMQQQQVQIRGHAIEVRLCAEDPALQFMPTSGRLTRLKWPANGKVSAAKDTDLLPYQDLPLRIETGFEQGDLIPANYDSMLAKVIYMADNRQQAAAGLYQALTQTEIAGVATNLGLLTQVLGHPVFKQDADHLQFGGLHTGFLQQYQILENLQATAPIYAWHMAAIAMISRYVGSDANPSHEGGSNNPWLTLSGWRLNAPVKSLIAIQLSADGVEPKSAGTTPRFTISKETSAGSTVWHLNDDSGSWRYQALTSPSGQIKLRLLARPLAPAPNTKEEATGNSKDSSLAIGQVLIAKIGQCELNNPRHSHSITLTLTNSFGEAYAGCRYHWLSATDSADEPMPTENLDALNAPLHGTVAAIEVSKGDTVKSGQLLMVLEAMKMEYPVKAPFNGEVSRLNFAVGDTVERGQALLALTMVAEEEEESGAAP